MMLSLNKYILWAAAGSIAALFGFGGMIYEAVKAHKFAKKVGMAVDEMKDATKTDIQEAIIERAVQDAAEREIARYVRLAGKEAMDRTKDQIRKRVKAEVEKSFGDISESVAREVSRQVSNIDRVALQRKIEEQAKQQIMEKFNGSLDNILGDFNQNLENTKKIYQSIADSISKPKTGATFTIAS